MFIGIAIPQNGFIDHVKADPGDVILSFNSPGQYPFGLTWDGEYLWTTNYDIDEKGIIYKLDPSDGSVITSFNSPISGNVPTGLTWDGTYLWSVESFFEQEEKGIIYKLDPSDGSVISSFNSPGNFPGGLAWDGYYLWNADWISDMEKGIIYKLDPSNGSVITSFNSPISGNVPTGLTWDGTYLWSVESFFEQEEKGIIYKLDPSDGSVISSFNSPGFLPVGLAWDGYYLWNADRIEDKIYKIEINESGEESDIIIEEIRGGFGLSVTIINNDTASAYNVSWSIDIEEDICLILSGSHTEEVIDKIDVNETVKIQSNNLRGIGLITITVQVADANKQATGFLLGPLVLRIAEI
jgi:DNA-binding beta-propeller fold protein YncE